MDRISFLFHGFSHLAAELFIITTGREGPLGQVRKQPRPLKLLGLGGLLNPFADDDEEVLSQHEGNALPLVAELLLLVIQEVTEVDVEQLEEREGEESESVGGAGGWLEERLTCPFSFTMMLELWRSPMPRMKVATQ